MWGVGASYESEMCLPKRHVQGLPLEVCVWLYKQGLCSKSDHTKMKSLWSRVGPKPTITGSLPEERHPGRTRDDCSRDLHPKAKDCQGLWTTPKLGDAWNKFSPRTFRGQALPHRDFRLAASRTVTHSVVLSLSGVPGFLRKTVLASCQPKNLQLCLKDGTWTIFSDRVLRTLPRNGNAQKPKIKKLKTRAWQAHSQSYSRSGNWGGRPRMEKASATSTHRGHGQGCRRWPPPKTHFLKWSSSEEHKLRYRSISYTEEKQIRENLRLTPQETMTQKHIQKHVPLHIQSECWYLMITTTCSVSDTWPQTVVSYQNKASWLFWMI